jgi:hypothetical protein
MKTRTDLKAGGVPGPCYPVFNKFGICKKMICPYPPYKFPCHDIKPLDEGPISFGSDTESATPDLMRRY